MDVCGAETPRSAYDNIAILFMPLKRGTRTYAELFAHLRRDGDLALCRNLGLCYRHDETLPG